MERGVILREWKGDGCQEEGEDEKNFDKNFEEKEKTA